jgi:cellulose synthase/poly-beta-1,6-N-acetylglucosamine synthase-like glycosyltransferase
MSIDLISSTIAADTATCSLHRLLADRDNDYRPHRDRWQARQGTLWTDPVDAATRTAPVSVVIPARNRAFAITAVLDALTFDQGADHEVIVVDDASEDDTAFRAAAHSSRPTVVRLDKSHGSSAARNVGTALATASTVVYLDGDMVVPPGTLRELASRATDDLVLLGFRQHVPYAAFHAGPLAPVRADLEQDPRVDSIVPAGFLPFSGTILDRPARCRLLDASDDLLDLGYGRWVHDWSLPRTVITAMVAMPRDAVIDCGGFHPGFHGLWGAEDAYVGAKLIAAGCRIAPVRPAVGLHLDPPRTQKEDRSKQASLARTVAFYRSLLAQPMPSGGRQWFGQHTSALLRDAVVKTTPPYSN